jgi:predicted GIY-YIG superfamily endonuclease
MAYSVRVSDRSLASRLEAAVKRLDRRGKEALVAGRLDPFGLLADTARKREDSA